MLNQKIRVMEVYDLFIVILPIFLVILVRFVLNNSPIPEDDIRQAQIELDEISEFNKKYFGKEVFYDAKSELMFGRIMVKGVVLILLGAIAAISTFFLFRAGCVNHLFAMTVSSIFLMAYGLALANRQKYVPILLLVAFALLLLFVAYYFNSSGLVVSHQTMKVSSFVLILGFLFFLIIPRVEKDDSK